MNRVMHLGNLPKILRTFLTSKLPGETAESEVWECTHDEIINKAKDEKFEVQVLIDKKDTGRAFMAALGASIRTIALDGNVPLLCPVFYFAELDEPHKRQYIRELAVARKKIYDDAQELKARRQAEREEKRKNAENESSSITGAS
jgi:hypothetical protein